MNAQQLREAYVKFFEERRHAHIGSASLIPENDPTVLFTTAGMHPLVPYLLGEKHPMGKRLVDFQKCIRTGDIDEVGDTSHLTFFEMLGNWSLGDYFKEESIGYSFDFLTDVLGFKKEQLAITVFAGEEGIPRDDFSAEIWKSKGFSDDQIFYYGRSSNWWGPAGVTGPCGPDTEIFYDTGQPKCSENCGPACNCGKYTEIWNNVFMEYFKNKDGKYTPLKQKNVDTGMGLERVCHILQGVPSVYESTVFQPIISKISEISGKRYEDPYLRDFRIIADHVRAAVFILADGVVPAKIGRGYILRRLIRRASRNMSKLGYNSPFMQKLAEVIVLEFGHSYPELIENKEFIFTSLTTEEEKFQKTLARGIKKFDELVIENSDAKILRGDLVFTLFDTYGFPIELTAELAKERGFTVDMKDFECRFKEHQSKSRMDVNGTFKGGLADNSEETTKLHTATHLLNAALRNLIDPNIRQKGSNITSERLRFDFNFHRKLTPEELQKISDFVNDSIKEDLPVTCREMPRNEAKSMGAIGVFDSKYGDIVKVYTIGNVSCEMCGGPHVTHTGELEGFKILKEESSASGIRRIKAVVGKF
ncbi:MAG: alanine--tRNA ligase [archaeon]|nr:alanine--tRNA ligase [archaeon]